MSKKEKISLPGSGGGIFRPTSGEGKGLKLTPIHIVGLCIVAIIFEIMLHLYGTALF
ncbi:MAG: hypothetical protein R6U26_01490 [Candidatus Undinarchaeales archaeon]